MKTKAFIIVATLSMIVLCSMLSWGQECIVYYHDDIPIYIEVEQSELSLQFRGIGIDEGILQLLDSYPSLTYNPENQKWLDDFALFGLDEPETHDSIMQCLREEEIVGFVYPVGILANNMRCYVSNTFTCRFDPSVTQSAIDSMMQEYHLELIEENEYMPDEWEISVTAETPQSVIDIANMFDEMPQVQYSQPDFWCPLKIDGYSVADEYYSQQPNIQRVVGIENHNNAAWEITTGDTNIYVGVIDQGLENHEDYDSTKFWYGFDFVGSYLEIFPGPLEKGEFHGVSVVGLLSSRHNNKVNDGEFKSTAGMAPNCRLFDVRVSDAEFVDIKPKRLAQAIGFTFRNGADIINFSLTWYGGYNKNIERAIDSAFNYGRDGKGTLIISSAGNHNDITGHHIFWPKSKDNVFTVGAVDNNDVWYNYSCYMDADVDLVAPSGPLYSFGDPHSGDGVWTTDRMGLLGDNPNGFDGCLPENDIDYRCTFGGTSAAAPLVTGTAALVLSKRPELTAAELMDVLKQSAVTDLAWGAISPPDEKYGYGMVNAFRALLAVARGNANNDGNIEIGDAVYLINYIFKGGPPPQPHMLMGDFNCDGMTNIGDVVSIISYVFRGGPPPDVCTDYLP